MVALSTVGQCPFHACLWLQCCMLCLGGGSVCLVLPLQEEWLRVMGLKNTGQYVGKRERSKREAFKRKKISSAENPLFCVLCSSGFDFFN